MNINEIFDMSGTSAMSYEDIAVSMCAQASRSPLTSVIWGQHSLPRTY